MKVYVVSVQQYYANHFYVDKVFASKEAAEKYKGNDTDMVIDELEVED